MRHRRWFAKFFNSILALRFSVLHLSFQAVDSVLKEETFDDDKVHIWIDQICDSCMRNLIDLGKPFKYAGAFVAACLRHVACLFLSISPGRVIHQP